MSLLAKVGSIRNQVSRPVAIGLGVALLFILVLAIALPLGLQGDDDRALTNAERVQRVLADVPLIDG
jgi:hypothetical protein